MIRMPPLIRQWLVRNEIDPGRVRAIERDGGGAIVVAFRDDESTERIRVSSQPHR